MARHAVTLFCSSGLAIVLKLTVFLNLMILCFKTCNGSIDMSSFNAAFYTNLPTKSSLQQVAVDSVTGNVYIGAKNALYLLGRDLDIKQSLKLGPVQDNARCRPLPANCSERRVATDNNVMVLEIHPKER